MLLIMLKFSTYFPHWMKTVPTYMVTFIGLLVVPILGFCHVHGTIGFIVTMSCIVIVSICNAILQGSIFGIAGSLPPIYTQAGMYRYILSDI
jgi:hypothetical protein